MVRVFQPGRLCLGRHTDAHLLFLWQTYSLSPKKVHSDLEACQKMVKKMWVIMLLQLHIRPCVDCPVRGRVTHQIEESPARLRRVEEGAKAK